MDLFRILRAEFFRELKGLNKSKSSLAVALQLLDPREYREVVLHYRRHLPHLLHVAAALAKESGSESTQVGLKGTVLPRIAQKV
jgi:hypothetical protein